MVFTVTWVHYGRKYAALQRPILLGDGKTYFYVLFISSDIVSLRLRILENLRREKDMLSKCRLFILLQDILPSMERSHIGSIRSAEDRRNQRLSSHSFFRFKYSRKHRIAIVAEFDRRRCSENYRLWMGKPYFGWRMLRRLGTQKKTKEKQKLHWKEVLINLAILDETVHINFIEFRSKLYYTFNFYLFIFFSVKIILELLNYCWFSKKF